MGRCSTTNELYARHYKISSGTERPFISIGPALLKWLVVKIIILQVNLILTMRDGLCEMECCLIKYISFLTLRGCFFYCVLWFFNCYTFNIIETKLCFAPWMWSKWYENLCFDAAFAPSPCRSLTSYFLKKIKEGAINSEDEYNALDQRSTFVNSRNP